MFKIIIVVVAVILITIVLVKVIDKFLPIKYKSGLVIGLWVLIAFLSYKTYMSIYTPILFNQEKEKRYAKVIKNLIDIRDAQLAHKAVTGKFNNNFDNLVKFIDTAKFTITQRRNSSVLDVTMSKQFGVDMYKEIVIIDTLGFVSVKDSLFKNSNRYKTMMNVPAGKEGVKFELEAGFISQNDINMPVFEARVKKSLILFDLDPDLVSEENKIISVEEVNGDALKVGSMTEVNTNGNWPKTYGDNN